MKTLKNQFKQKNIESSDLLKIIKKYSKRDCVKIALYVAEDNFHLRSTKESKLCIDLVKSWLENEKSVTSRELKRAINSARLFSGWDDGSGFIWATTNAAATAAVTGSMAAAYSVLDAVANAIDSLPFDEKEPKREEYLSYARLFAYEDLSFPYKDISKTFNLDNPTDLNIFLDFLTDNYPEAITYDREGYFTKRLPRENLRILYQ